MSVSAIREKALMASDKLSAAARERVAAKARTETFIFFFWLFCL